MVIESGSAMNEIPGRERFADDTDQPLTQEQERFLRRVRLIAVTGATIIFAGFAVVLVTVVMRLSDEGPGPIVSGPPPGITDYLNERQELAAGEEVTDATAAGNWLTVVVTRTDGTSRVLVFALQDMTLVRELETVRQ